MKKKQIVDLITSIVLIVVGSILLIFPLMKVLNVKYVFMAVLTIYGIMNLIQFVLTSKEKDYEGLFTMIVSIITLIILGFIDTNSNPINLALVLFIWIMLMSFVKLKKADYYHDRGKQIWILKMVLLFLFILIGLLSVINLYYEPSVQILVLGFFYFVHGLLELIDPLVNYLIKK